MENKNISVLELFGGIGACTKALKNIGMNVNVVDYVEIDKYACKSYNAINGTNFEPQDIKEWDKDINIDLIMHGSPCQDFSVAGKQAGGDLGSGTRSSLMYETIRIVGKLRPKYVVWENVKNLLSKKHKHNFDAYIETMNILGYNSYYQVLNAKDYGIPQNRERVYTISIRKDIDKGTFIFPEKEVLKLRLKDMLEDEVEEKYYLSKEVVSKYVQSKENNTNVIGNLEPKIITYNIPQKVKVRKYNVNIEKLKYTLRNAKLETDISNKEIAKKINIPLTQVEHYFRKDNSFAIPDSNIWIKLKELLNIKTNEFDKSVMTFEEKDGVYDKAERVYDEKGLAPTLTQQQEKIKKDFSIRKITPKECWRLMGFSDEDFEKAANIPTSNTQLYKQAGNSIVVNVLEKIFLNLFKGD